MLEGRYKESREILVGPAKMSKYFENWGWEGYSKVA